MQICLKEIGLFKEKLLKEFSRQKNRLSNTTFYLKNYLIPKLGVSSRCGSKGSKGFYKGIANIGYRPTFGVNDINLEVNIFGFNQDLYNKNIKYYLKNLLDQRKNLKILMNLSRKLLRFKKDLTKNVKRDHIAT